MLENPLGLTDLLLAKHEEYRAPWARHYLAADPPQELVQAVALWRHASRQRALKEAKEAEQPLSLLPEGTNPKNLDYQKALRSDLKNGKAVYGATWVVNDTQIIIPSVVPAGQKTFAVSCVALGGFPDCIKNLSETLSLSAVRAAGLKAEPGALYTAGQAGWRQLIGGIVERRANRPRAPGDCVDLEERQSSTHVPVMGCAILGERKLNPFTVRSMNQPSQFESAVRNALGKAKHAAHYVIDVPWALPTWRVLGNFFPNNAFAENRSQSMASLIEETIADPRLDLYGPVSEWRALYGGPQEPPPGEITQSEILETKAHLLDTEPEELPQNLRAVYQYLSARLLATAGTMQMALGFAFEMRGAISKQKQKMNAFTPIPIGTMPSGPRTKPKPAAQSDRENTSPGF